MSNFDTIHEEKFLTACGRRFHVTAEMENGVCVLEAINFASRHRYFVTVMNKWRPCDAQIGALGWIGCTKAEAMAEAGAVSANLTARREAVAAARMQAFLWDTSSNRHTQKLQEESLRRLLNRYSEEVA